MKYIASNSNGKDSLWMILELIRRKCPLDLVIFFDAGKEFDAIYGVWDKLKTLLDANGIAWDVIEPEEDFDYYFCEKPVKSKNKDGKKGYSWCGGVCRWMTTQKVKQIKKYYKEHFPNETIVEYVGIAADELDRVDMKRQKNSVKYYPLIMWGYTENDCFVGCYKAGFDWSEPGTDVELYQKLDRVSCWCCRNKNLKELKAMWKYLPDYWERLKQMQQKTDIPFREDASIEELEKRFQQEDEQQVS